MDTHHSELASKPSKRSTCKGGSFVNVLVFIIVLCVVAFVGWVLLEHFIYKTKKNSEKESSTRQAMEVVGVDEPSEEDKLLIQRELDRREAEKAEETVDAQKKRLDDNVKAVELAIQAKNWTVAEEKIGLLLDDSYPLTEIAQFNERIATGKLQESGDLVEVQRLLEEAKQLDKGNYSPEAVDLVDRALLIYPGYAPSEALKKKLNAYPYSLRVPEDVLTLNDAVDMLRPGDTAILGKGIHKLPSMLDKGIHIKGQGEKLTTIECDTTKTSAFTLTGEEEFYKLSNLTVQGSTYDDTAAERFPLIMLNANLTMLNVTVKEGSGHGVAVVSGRLNIAKCTIRENAWDGVSVMGVKSHVLMTDCDVSGNYDHGVDFWGGASGKLTNVTANKNAGSGVIIMGNGAKVSLVQVKTEENRQCGIVINSQAEAQLERVFSSGNRLSGIVLQGSGTKLTCGITVSNKNGEAGFLIDPEASVENFISATSEGNAGGDVIRKTLVVPNVPVPQVPVPKPAKVKEPI